MNDSLIMAIFLGLLKLKLDSELVFALVFLTFSYFNPDMRHLTCAHIEFADISSVQQMVSRGSISGRIFVLPKKQAE